MTIGKVLIFKNVLIQLSDNRMSHDDKLSGTLLVNCSGGACRRVIQESKKMEGVTFVFRVDKKSQKDPDVIIDVSGSKDLIQKVENNIRKIGGVHSVNHEIGSSLLY
jgi:DNA-binding Lrp family transcriptional regulator